MKLLQEKIRRDGVVKPGNILKVDSFLNHQLDVLFLDKMGEEFYSRFKDENITKILTIEASGIAIASLTGLHFKVPVVFAKKSKSINLDGEMYVTNVESFTHKNVNNVIVAKKFLNPQDRILILDDFLATGNALVGLISLVEESGASVAGIGIAIEKGFQDGGKMLREKGLRVESLAIVESMDAEQQTIVFRDDA